MGNTKWPFYEELDLRQTELGELMLRRRRPMSMPDTWVYEVKLDDRLAATVDAGRLASRCGADLGELPALFAEAVALRPAVLLPFAIILAIGWVLYRVRRRRSRESTLD